MQGSKIVFFIICLFMVAFHIKVGFTTDSGVIERLIYPFFHAGVIHFAINMIALNTMYRCLNKVAKWYEIVAVAFLSSFVTTFVSASEKETIGASSLVFFMVGADLVIRWTECYFRIDVRKMIIYTSSIAIFLLVSAFGNTNFILHISNLFLGVIYGTIKSCQYHSRKS